MLALITEDIAIVIIGPIVYITGVLSGSLLPGGLSIFISSSSIEVSYASPSSLYYSVIYKAAREKEYQIFVLRDEEYLPSHIKDIYKPFTDDIKNQFNKEHFYYDLDDVSYGIKLNTSNYKINNYLSFEENHDYYLSITDDSSLIITFLNEIL